MKMLIAVIIVLVFLVLPYGVSGKQGCSRTIVSYDSIVPVLLKGNILVNWDNVRSCIKEDALYIRLKKNFALNKDNLIDEISNGEYTTARACGKIELLTKGQVAFLVIDQIKGLPWLEVLRIQFDVFYVGCPYPYGFLDYLKIYGKDVQTIVKNYLKDK